MLKKLAIIIFSIVASVHTLSAQEARLAAGQRVEVAVFQQPELSRVYSIGANGILSMSLIGDIQAAGLTTSQLEAAIRSRLVESDYLRNPQVSVVIESYGSFFVTGEVIKPGAYDFSTRMTVSQAIAMAGGYSLRAQKKYVCVKRDTNELVSVSNDTCKDDAGAKIDKKDVATTFIQPGDVITVNERFF